MGAGAEGPAGDRGGRVSAALAVRSWEVSAVVLESRINRVYF